MIIFMWEASIKLPEGRMAAIAMAFAAGILASSYFDPICCLAICAVFVVAGLVSFRDNRRAIVIILGAVFLLGMYRFLLHIQTPVDDISRMPGRVIAFEGSIAEDPDVRSSGTRIVLRANSVQIGDGWHKVSGLVMVTVRLANKDQIRLSYGDRLQIDAHPYRPFDPTNPGQFSYKDYLARQGIHTCASVRNLSQIKIITGKSGNSLVRSALAAKNCIAASIERIHPKQQASVIIGMVLGTYSYLPKKTFDNFARTGTLHLLAASGYNCFILLWLALPILKLIRLPAKLRNIVVILLLVLYVMMVGTMPSLIRAAIMSGLWLLALPLGRVPNIKNLFFTAGLVTLAIRPSDLFDVGFQLSFAAVWALITSASLIQSALVRMGLYNDPWSISSAGNIQQVTNALTSQSKFTRRLKNYAIWDWSRREVVSAAVATITVTLYTTPIVAYYFNNFSLVSLPANVALALSVPIVFAVGLISVVAANVPYIGVAVGFIGTKVTDFILAIVNYLGSSQYSAVTVATPGPLAVFGYYILLFVGLSYLRSKYAK
ncbi:MAG: ComEC/Rec2 family competence protein [Armatimonadetes bacterium]|nr:ComEC/Rec2 family competence protein [Armatimonadota bacterium]